MPKNSRDNLYKNEQEQIKNKVLEILEITQDKNFFTLYELDNNMEKQNAILALESECEKYFACGQWTYFRNKMKDNNKDRPYLLLSRNILSACNVDFYNKNTTLTIDNIKHSTVKYFINV